MQVWSLFLTKRQKEVLDAQRLKARSSQIPHERLGLHPSTVHSHNTLIFKNFVEALELMTDEEVFEVMRGRFKKKKHGSKVWDLTRALRLQLKEVI
tara:strand:- start:149 stop:436 length:288 start_codon:yes stop_codon:yes gene_type:complete